MFVSHSSQNIKWSTSLTPITIKSCNVKTGPKFPIPQAIKEVFFLFLTSSVLDLIVKETNHYAASCIENWNPTTLEEICAYFGFMILMGIVNLPSIYVTGYEKGTKMTTLVF